ncbi:MAG: solute:sodium symporter family transporter [Candidatus Latescibacteria bacterium]|nr:solute:sodium symporter family transporter [Candidatus Latescibacterota bacterium]
MELSILDIGIFFAFFVVAIGTSLYKSRKEETGEDFFLASRGLHWPLIGLSLIAANISTEHFVGMSGQGAGISGFAVASYEWMAAITLVIVAIFFLPKFLKSGIYTIPEYLEYRYNAAARAIMAFYTVLIYVFVTIAAVVYSGALTLNTIFDMKLIHAVWLIGGIAALYTTWGGLKAVAWADLFQGSALIIGGAITLVLSFNAVGGVGNFFENNSEKLHMILPSDHSVIPWTALVLGLWIPNFYYWGLNQYITQRTLAAQSLKQGQIGILFAAGLKLTIPFIIIFPGIMAAQLYKDQLTVTSDAAYPLLIKNLIPVGIRGFIFAAISGAVISSLASMLNSASTIFTMDLYKRHFKKNTSQKTLVTVGRIMTMVFVVIGCLIAPQLGADRFKGIFNFIQEFQGFISPGILAAFVFGLIIAKTPPAAGVTALLLNVPIYGFLLKFFNEIAFLNRMAITFGILLAVMAIITVISPLTKPKEMPVRKDFDMKPAPSIIGLGTAIIIITLVLYIIFW